MADEKRSIPSKPTQPEKPATVPDKRHGGGGGGGGGTKIEPSKPWPRK